MKKILVAQLILVLISSCKKSSESIIVASNDIEKLAGPPILAADWTLELFAPAWMGRRSGVTSFVIGNYAYIVGGYDHTNNTLTKDLYRFDPATHSYTTLAPMPTDDLARMHAVAFTINNRGYVATGYGAGVMKDLWEYNPAKGMGGSWTKKADLPGPARWKAVGFSINNKGYVATGNPFGNPIKDVWEYDPVNDTWTEKASMPTNSGRDEAFVFVLGTKAYIGCGNTTPLRTVWEFNPTVGTNGTWTQKANYPGLAVERLAAFSANKLGYAGTGLKTEGSFIYYNDFWSYSNVTNTWTKRTDFPGYQRGDAVGFAINGVGFMGLGYNQFYTSTNDLYRYTPPAN